MKIDKPLLKKLMMAVSMTRADEIGCDDCFDKLHVFAEKELLGRSAEKAMPLVYDHLQRCGECRQEYESLLIAIKGLKRTE